MKKIILLLFLTNFATIASAQINRHAWMIGGSLEFRKENQLGDLKVSTFSVQPYLGFLLSEHFLLGIRPHFLSSLRDNTPYVTKSREIGMGVFARFYPFNKTKVLPFAQAGFQRINYRIRQSGQTDPNPIEDYDNTAFGGVGLDFFISPNIALEGNIEYNSTTTELLSVRKRSLTLRVGFQVFLNNSPK